ncbi:GNAT family N-acetyltransferase [Curtobacterium sp. MCPF17_050]|uniref:GNAT family N-acetyltransferase n=1 Tax=Curtobacterium sp. MCPF17_050 TaxID=2175664 RepID=UPI000D8DD777|nr:GNAT family N-acetyltransferase [Curtobacterium sp. MCPF17_050]WIB16481.1 GNAT family N-acetyltransferase [Curtobacterium sp. MCPF17_050]
MSPIRLVSPEDSTALADLLVRNREFLAPWSPIRADGHETVEGQRSDIALVLDRHQRGEAAPFVILDDDGGVAGRLTLSGIVRGPFRSCAMGYWLSEDRTGRGLATRAVAAALGHAFDELALHRVQAETLVHNTASQRVLARNGFLQYGQAPRYLEIAGRWQDHLMFQRLRDDPPVAPIR